jgi:hypothetical protein
MRRVGTFLFVMLLSPLADAHHKVIPDDDTILSPGSVNSDPHAPTRLPLDDDDVLPPSSKVVGTVAKARPSNDTDDVLPPGTVRVGKVSHPQNDDDVLEPGAVKATNGRMVFRVDVGAIDDDVLAPGQAKTTPRDDDDDPRIKSFKGRVDDDDVLAPTFKNPPPSGIKPIEP